MNNIRKLLQQAITTHVPDCVLFSGGIDSSAILYESRIINTHVKAITVGVKENYSEDIKYSKYISQKIGADLLVCNVDREYIIVLYEIYSNGLEYRIMKGVGSE